MASVKRVALVTGGANGIGRAICKHLLGAGWRIGVVDLPDSGLARHGERSGFVTGANFVIDGGMTRRMIYEE